MSEEKKEDYEQLKEGYNHLKKAEIKAAYQMYQSILDACDMLVQESKVNRAPRKKKPVSKDKIVAKVKYCKQDTVTKSVSIKLFDCLDASQLWYITQRHVNLVSTIQRNITVFHLRVQH